MNRRDALQFTIKDTRLSLTLPEGAPSNWAELIGSLLPHKSRYADLRRIFHLHEATKAHGLSATALGHDTTADARTLIKCPVALVGSTRSKVVNLFHDRATLSHHKLSQINSNYEPSNVRRTVTKMMENLFPNASTRLVAMVPGYAHSGLGRNAKVWEQLLTEVQQIPLAA